MRYIATTLLAIGLLTGSALTAPFTGSQIPHHKRSPVPFDNSDPLGDGGEVGVGNPPRKRSPININLPAHDPSIPSDPSRKRSPVPFDNSDPLGDGGEVGVGNPPRKRSPININLPAYDPSIPSDPSRKRSPININLPAFDPSIPSDPSRKRSPVPFDNSDPLGDGGEVGVGNPPR